MNRAFVVLAAGGLLAACRPAPEAPAKPRFNLEQLNARFPADLGPETVDVSGYPKRIQEGAEVFAKTCAQCHSLARPINAPQVTRDDWESLIKRMHEKSLVYGWWTQFGKEDARRILDFLAYDSQVRKVDKKEDFARRTAELQALYAEVQKEKERLQLEEGRRAARPAPDYVGDKPGGGR